MRKSTVLANHILFYWLPWAVWTGLLLYFAFQVLLPSPFPGIWGLILRKAGHAAFYGISFWLTFRLLGLYLHKFAFISLFSFVISSAIAISDERIQLFLRTRHGSIADFLIDFGGMVVVFFIIWLYRNGKS